MEAYLRASHPRVTEPTEQQCLCMTRRSVRREKHNVCFTSTGAHGFLGGKDSKGELEAYGVGISLCTSPSPPCHAAVLPGCNALVLQCPGCGAPVAGHRPDPPCALAGPLTAQTSST